MVISNFTTVLNPPTFCSANKARWGETAHMGYQAGTCEVCSVQAAGWSMALVCCWGTIMCLCNLKPVLEYTQSGRQADAYFRFKKTQPNHCHPYGWQREAVHGQVMLPLTSTSDKPTINLHKICLPSKADLVPVSKVFRPERGHECFLQQISLDGTVWCHPCST